MEKDISSTKNIILQAAYELFLNKGFEETSFQDIIQASWVSKGGIYHYFASKDVILSEVIQLEWAPLIEWAKRIFEAQNIGIREKFLEWMELKNDFYRNKYSLLRRVFVENSNFSFRFRIISEIKNSVTPIIKEALETNTEWFPHLQEMWNLFLCCHEVIFSYGLSEIKTEEEFEAHLGALQYFFTKAFSK